MYLAHGPISYITNELIQRKRISKLSPHEKTIAMILSIIFGILPDIDLAILSMTSTPVFLHHKVFSHSITFYLLLWFLLVLVFQIVKRILNKEGRKTLNENLLTVIHYSFLIGTVTHLLSDALFSSLVLFYPFRFEINILGQVLRSNYFSSFLYSPSFAIEVLAILIFLGILFKRYIKNIKVFKYPLYFSIALSGFYLLFSIYMNLNTYNMSIRYENGQEIFDIDYDGVQDINDVDVNNNGSPNILEYDTKEGKKFAESISNNRYFVSTYKSKWDKIKFNYGAFTSYRVISQTYFEQNLALEPVLLDYAKKRDRLQTYSLIYSYPTLLFEYSKENGYLTNPNYKVDNGKVFFILKDNTFVNMGILLDESNFVTVLQGDRRLIKHTKEEIQSTYPKAIIKVLNIP